MSDIHILESSRSGDRMVARVVFHIADPSPPNNIDLAPETDGSIVPNIDGAELASIQGGSVIEHSTSIAYHVSETNAAVQTRLRAKYAAESAGIIADRAEKYRAYLAGFAQ